MTLDLSIRAGWPAELRILLVQYPREVWPDHENLGELTRFWLERHAWFRAFGGSLEAALAEFREGTLALDEFRRLLAPRLQHFLQSLEGHHQIEDLHYFPIFRAAEPRLMRGFDVLEGDHEAIHTEIGQVVDAANQVLGQTEETRDSMRAATDRYAGASEQLLKSLSRHLDDEEDLIVPVILHQSERKLFHA